MAYEDQDERLTAIHTGLVNLRDDPELNGPMGEAGYTSARIEQLIAQQAAATAAAQAQRREYGDQRGATAAFNAAWETANTHYMRHLTLARVVYKKDIARQVQLGLQGDRKDSFSGLEIPGPAVLRRRTCRP